MLRRFNLSEWALTHQTLVLYFMLVLAAAGKAFCAGHNLKEMIATPELAYYQRLLRDATDDIAFVKQARVSGLTESAFVFTTLEDRANRIYVTVNSDYYDRSLPKSTPQHILIRLRHEDLRSLNHLGNGPRHLESFQKLREIVRANLPELRSMVK